jgi:hypothetical protein
LREARHEFTNQGCGLCLLPASRHPGDFEISDGLRGLNTVKRVFNVGPYFAEETGQLLHSLSCGFVVNTTFKYANGVRTMHTIDKGSHEDR